MPPRSNLFQRLIRDLHAQLASNCSIIESAMLIDRLSGDAREVDIVLRSVVGGYELVVSIECRDRSRPATIEWVEQMIEKHNSLPTNKLILVSRTGFTQTAKAKADRHGVETYTLEEAGHVDWTKLVDDWSELRFEGMDLNFDIFALVQWPDKLVLQGLNRTFRFVTPNGEQSTNVDGILDYLLLYSDLEAKLSAERQVTPTAFVFGLEFAPRVTIVAEGEDTGRIVHLLVFEGRYERNSAEMNTTRAAYRCSQIAFSNANVSGIDVTLTIVEGQQAASTARLSLDRPDGRRVTIALEDPKRGLSPTTAEIMHALFAGDVSKIISTSTAGDE